MSGRTRWIVSGEGFVSLQVLAKPASRHRGILRRDANGLVIALNSPTDKGKANDELFAFLAGLLGVPRSSISITRGQAGRVKTVRIENPKPARVASLLSTYS
jgi:uncharacterized protein